MREFLGRVKWSARRKASVVIWIKCIISADINFKPALSPRFIYSYSLHQTDLDQMSRAEDPLDMYQCATELQPLVHNLC